MSIFNTTGEISISGNKVAVWSSGSANRLSAISFTVDSAPTEWLLVCVGAESTNTYYTTNSSSYYMVTSAQNGSTEGSVIATSARYYNSYVRLYRRTTVTSSYSNGVFTLTGGSGDYFYGRASNATPIFYYLFYKTA